ncbi:MAG: cytochrome-c peroxidase [Planctomycetes bacterium]|nr:cytochrome-c peroxidase [Planctomycetota bacterium]
MSRSGPPFVVVMLLALVVCTSAASEERTHTLAQFTRPALLGRFDEDRDGKLSEKERATLRKAFGGLDVPMLPAEPFHYATVARPGHVDQSQLREWDNTPADNPLTNHGATLGRVLFYDRQLSRNGSVACASCHRQDAGFTDPRRLSVGLEGGRTRRNAMGLANLRYTNLKGRRPGFFWDERAQTLEDQALMPIQDEVEMGMALDDLCGKLCELPYYPPLFEAAFDSSEVTSERVARAIAQFVRSLESWDSRFDREAAAALKAGDGTGDFAGFTREENLGKRLFLEGLGGVAEFACAMCHIPPTFNTEHARNIGLELDYKDPGLGGLERPPNEPFTPSNEGKFKAPSLRNIELTAPYMHDGRFATLEEVVEHYSGGVHPHPNLALAFEDDDSPEATSGMRFTQEQKTSLVAFLKTLTDKRFVSDERFSDPFIRGGE